MTDYRIHMLHIEKGLSVNDLNDNVDDDIDDRESLDDQLQRSLRDKRQGKGQDDGRDDLAERLDHLLSQQDIVHSCTGLGRNLTECRYDGLDKDKVHQIGRHNDAHHDGTLPIPGKRTSLATNIFANPL